MNVSIKNYCRLKYEDMCMASKGTLTAVWSTIKANDSDELCVTTWGQVFDRREGDTYMFNTIYSNPVWYKDANNNPKQAFDISLNKLKTILAQHNVVDIGNLMEGEING